VSAAYDSSGGLSGIRRLSISVFLFFGSRFAERPFVFIGVNSWLIKSLRELHLADSGEPNE